MMPGTLSLVAVFFMTVATSSLAEFSFKIAVRDDGIYQVGFADLGYSGKPPQSSRLFLSNRGKATGFLVDDGGDGVFGPGDHFTFTGRHLEGEHSWFNRHSVENIYLLDLESPGVHGTDVHVIPTENEPIVSSPVIQHFEQEKLRAALPESANRTIETWYWKRLGYLARKPFQLPLHVELVPTGIRVSFAGLSLDRAAQAVDMPQHTVDLMLNGTPIGRAEWDGQEAFVIEVGQPAIDLAYKRDQAPILEIRVPRRKHPDSTSTVIDLVLLNWVEIEYSPDAGEGRFTIPHHKGAQRLLVNNHYLSPVWIKPQRPHSLREDADGYDYLMITHGSLVGAVEPLAELHRRQGLVVNTVEVQDIYDEFNHGIASPNAIRDFIEYTGQKKATPLLRYVLLAGDASWDIYSETGAVRNLIPTMQVRAHDELAASDNGFVTLVGDDWRPDLAIGRIPAASTAELAGVVKKIIAYSEDESNASWQKRATWITDATANFQNFSTRLASVLNKAGFTVNTVYPGEKELTVAQDQQDIVDAINDGQLLLHFLGHGGRFVWRTGPPDLRNSSDLFSVNDIEQLQNQGKLPFVLSMSCSSGPFDHPEAGSIAESFIMLPKTGAIGVLAASWRVPALESFSSLLIKELTDGAQSIGVAIMKAKQAEDSQVMVESYNFFGDPALKLKLPVTQ